MVDFQVLLFSPFVCVSGQGSQSGLGDYNSDVTSAPTVTSRSADESSSSHTASVRCEATFESSKLGSVSVAKPSSV